MTAAKLPENERYLRACSDIANALIQEYEWAKDPTKPKRDINLNKLRGQVAKKHTLGNQPPLTAIIAAVPEHYKKYILPKLIAKPIRMCSPPPPSPSRSCHCRCHCRCSVPPSGAPVPFPWLSGYVPRALTLRSRDLVGYRRRCCDVQTPPLSPYCVYR